MAAAPAAIAAILLLRLLPPSRGDPAAGINISVICFDLETMEVAWGGDGGGANLSLHFRYGAERFRPCPRYALRGDLTSGCVFPARRAELLEISVSDGAEPVFSVRQPASNFLKPRPLADLTFCRLGEDRVAVTCSDLPYRGLFYEVEHRRVGGASEEWQAERNMSCHVTVDGLDPTHCYAFRARAKPRAPFYSSNAHPGDWTTEVLWRGPRHTGSCAEAPPTRAFPALPLASGLVTLLTSLLLLLALLRLRRVKDALMPCVPDPSGTFPGLFEKHHGNFQAWISDAHVTPVTTPATPESPARPAEEEDALVVREKGAGPDVTL